MTTSTSEQKLFNVAELLRLPQFPDCEFGIFIPDSLRLLNEGLLFAQSDEEIGDALESLEEARDQIESLIATSEDVAKVYSMLCEEVSKIEEEDKENLTIKEFNSLIFNYSGKLWVLRAKRSLNHICSDCFDPCEFLSSTWHEVEGSLREVMSWFGIEISEEESLLSQSELLQRHLPKTGK